MLDAHVGDWRVVRDLFHVYRRAVLAPGLKSLPQNRIKWLFEALIIGERGEVATDDHLETFHWVVLELSRLVQIGRHRAKVLCDDDQSGI